MNCDEMMDVLSSSMFESAKPDVFFKCEGAVFAEASANSFCYTTSTERAELLAAILNEWATLRRKVKRES